MAEETLGNGVFTKRTFDAVTGWMSKVESGIGSGAALQNESYLFDRVGNLTQRQNGNLGLTENFYYDNLHRLDYSQLGSVTNLDLSYDAMGNITSRSDVAGGATWTYHSTKKHAVTQAGSSSYTYSYDANGNAQTRNGYAITWTSYNYPSAINGPGKTMTFSYGPDRQRYKQVYTNGSTTETTTYIGGMLEKVAAGGMTDWRHYVRAGGNMVAVVSRLSTGTNTTRYVLEDHQGSVSQIIDSAGAAYVSESFTAYGARRDASDWSGGCPCPDLAKIKSTTRMGYTGHEAIGGVSMGLNHMNGRVQDAITGRFLSPDPYITEPGNTQNYNRYSYVYNNPMSYVDPSGFKGTTRFISNFPGNTVETVTVERERWVEQVAREAAIRDRMSRERDRQGTAGDGTLTNRGNGGDSGIIEEVITTAPKVPPPPAPPPPILVPFAPAVQFTSAESDHSVVGGTREETGNQEEEIGTCSGSFLKEFIAEHGSISFSWNGGRLYGGGFSISLSTTGLDYWVGAGVGMGSGVSATVDVSSDFGPRSGHPPGFGLIFGVSGGTGTVGGQASVNIGPKGGTASAGLGWGLGLGGFVGAGHSGTLIDLSLCK